jgi:hypothetical protein
VRKSIGFLPTLVLGLASAIVSIGPGRAAAITYDLSTFGTGSLNGVAFTDASVVLEMQNDTTKVVKQPPAIGESTFTNTGTMTLLVSGFPKATFNFPGTIGVTQFPSDGFLPAITLNSNQLLVLGAFNRAFSTYNLKTNVGPVVGDTIIENKGIGYPTSSGPLVLNSGFDTMFTAQVGLGAEAVPEASSWMLLAIGFAGLGLLHRRGLLRGSAAGRG